MTIQIYAINSVVIYCLITLGFDLTYQLFGVKPFFISYSPEAVPVFALTWVILLFHKPTKNFFVQADFIGFRQQIIGLGALFISISILYCFFAIESKSLGTKTISQLFLTELARIMHIFIFYFSLYTGTYSQVFTNKLSSISVHKAIRIYFSALSQTVVLGGMILFSFLFIAVALDQNKKSPAMIQNALNWDLAEKAADEHETAVVKKTCVPMTEKDKENFLTEYYYNLQSKFIGPN